jgi:hypothetical protein
MEKGKEKLQKSLEYQVKRLQKELLNTSELVVSDEKWQLFRKQILSITSDMSRRLIKDIEENYIVDYSPSYSEDIIKIQYKDKRNGDYRNEHD